MFDFLASLLAATLYQENPERDVFHMQMLLECCYI